MANLSLAHALKFNLKRIYLQAQRFSNLYPKSLAGMDFANALRFIKWTPELKPNAEVCDALLYLSDKCDSGPPE